MSKYWPKFVFVLFLSWFCLIIPTFVHSLPSRPPTNLTYVLSLSQIFTKTLQQIVGTLSRQILEWDNFSFTTWSPCIWTKNRQTLDLGCWTISRQSKDKVSVSKMGHGPRPTARLVNYGFNLTGSLPSNLRSLPVKPLQLPRNKLHNIFHNFHFFHNVIKRVNWKI